MRLVRLAIRDFRNLGEVDISTDAPVVLFHGDNGQGKTNLLEAIYVLSTLKSFRSRTNAELVRWESERALVMGEMRSQGSTRDFRIEITSSARSARIDGKPPSSLPDYFRGIRSVLFAPEHVQIVRGEPEQRRRFLDRAIFTSQPGFVEIARGFKRLLGQKSALLKQDQVDLAQLDALDLALADMGARVTHRRQEMVERLAVPFSKVHDEIAGTSEAVLVLRTKLAGGDKVSIKNRYLELLAERRSDEIRRQVNLVGPQRDDLEILIEGKPARSFGSQGQVRSLVLALKLAELDVARSRGVQPLFLLDDLSSELDRARRVRLVRLLSDLEVQCFVSTTDPGLLSEAIPVSAQQFRVTEGTLTNRDPKVQAVS